MVWFEALGKCRMIDGRPAQHPAPWIQIAAVSREQTRNTMTLLGPMLSKDAIAEFGVDLGKEIIYCAAPVALRLSPRALAHLRVGARPSW